MSVQEEKKITDNEDGMEIQLFWVILNLHNFDKNILFLNPTFGPIALVHLGKISRRT